MTCGHQQWLCLRQDGNGFAIEHGNRLDNIAASLPHPAKQYPSLIFFLGKQSKSRALRALYPGSGISGCRGSAIANVCLDSTTACRDSPTLVADANPERSQSISRGKDTCHETITHPVAWADRDGVTLAQQELTDHVHARLLFLFTHVLCIFASDFESLDQVAEQLGTWTALGSASSLPGSVNPRLLVVTSVPGADFHADVLRFRLRILSDGKFADAFSSLNVVNILGAGRASRRDFSALEAVLSDEAGAARRERVNTHTLFSMVHISAFFDMALRDFARSPQHTFDFIRRTREDNPVPPEFQQHLDSFMSLCSQQKLPESILWEFIASAIIMDCFHQTCIVGAHLTLTAPMLKKKKLSV